MGRAQRLEGSVSGRHASLGYFDDERRDGDVMNVPVGPATSCGALLARSGVEWAGGEGCVRLELFFTLGENEYTKLEQGGPRLMGKRRGRRSAHARARWVSRGSAVRVRCCLILRGQSETPQRLRSS